MYAIDSSIFILRASTAQSPPERLQMHHNVTVLHALHHPQWKRDVLVIGTTHALLVYDVHENADVFYKDIDEGVLALGHIIHQDRPFILLGGDCCIQGYGLLGEEILWTVASDRVVSLLSLNSSSLPDEFLVACEDGSFTWMNEGGENIAAEWQESDQPVALVSLNDGLVGFLLQNGHVGVLKRSQRLWKRKLEDAVCLATMDMDGDGQRELIVGFRSGSWHVFRAFSGDVVFQFDARNEVPLSRLLCLDHEMMPLLVSIQLDGVVEARSRLIEQHGEKEQTQTQVDEQLRKLAQRKHQLTMQLKRLKESQKEKHDQNETGLGAVIPADTKISVELRHGADGLYLHAATSNDCIIRFITISAEGLFDQPMQLFASDPPQTSASHLLPIDKVKTAEAEVKVYYSAHVGEWFTFDTKQLSIPLLALFQPSVRPVQGITSYASYEIAISKQRLCGWLRMLFIDAQIDEEKEEIDVTFSRPGAAGMRILMSPVRGNISLLSIWTPDLELLGVLVQSLGNTFQVAELQPKKVVFPEKVKHIDRLAEDIAALNEARLRMQNEMADVSNAIKAFVVKAEDLRLQRNM